jgi:hypothetical protein
LSWHCWLHAVEFFMAKFLAHQLSQKAAHLAEAATASVAVNVAPAKPTRKQTAAIEA